MFAMNFNIFVLILLLSVLLKYYTKKFFIIKMISVFLNQQAGLVVGFNYIKVQESVRLNILTSLTDPKPLWNHQSLELS